MTRRLHRTPVILGMILIVAILRVGAPTWIQNRLTDHLMSFSPLYAIEIEDMDLSFLRMAYSFQGLRIRQKTDRQVVTRVDDIDVSLAWREILRGRVAADIVITGAAIQFDRSAALLAVQQKQRVRQDAETAGGLLFPVQITRLRLVDSIIAFRKLKGVELTEPLSIRHLRGGIDGLIPSSELEKTSARLTGQVIGGGEVHLTGDAYLKKKPVVWSARASLQRFPLTKANDLLVEFAPLTFRDGHLDLFARLRGDGHHLEGSVRPFLTSVDLVGDAKDFKLGIGQVLMELVSELGDLILRDRSTRSVATQIDFKKAGGEWQIDTGKALRLAVQHGFGEDLPRRIPDPSSARD